MVSGKTDKFLLNNKFKDQKRGQTKIQQLVHVLSEAIAHGELTVGDMLPSVNHLSSMSGFSRDTVFKAYRILKQRSLVDSAPTRGYFVTGGNYRIFMLLDDFSSFKEQLYQSFRSCIPESYSVDLLFHHYNHEIFNQLVENSLGRYSAYVVMNIDNKGMEPVLEKIEPDRLLILDMGKPPEGSISYVVQDFDLAVEHCLDEGREHMQKYNELILVYDENNTPHPPETVSAVKRFCLKNNLNFKNIPYAKGSGVKNGECWFTIHDSDLVEVFKRCRESGLKPGKDVGILSYNDTPMKEIAGGGVSVISTSFSQMGVFAAQFVKNRKRIAEILPTSFILRETF